MSSIAANLFNLLAANRPKIVRTDSRSVPNINSGDSDAIMSLFGSGIGASFQRAVPTSPGGSFDRRLYGSRLSMFRCGLPPQPHPVDDLIKRDPFSLTVNHRNHI